VSASEPDLANILRRGVELCRGGDWDRGLAYLGRIAEADRASGLPGIFYSYLGYGIASRQKRVQEGLKLCRHAVKVQFYEPENYVNLTRTLLLAGERPAAVRAVLDGLKVDRNNEELLALYRELGIRRLPVLPFLSRSNPLNQFLGRVRSAWQSSREPKADPKTEPEK
jgi:tetratricopeptide (TPR) repeat protein